MEITPRELRDVEIREAFRGYSRDEVNELLERAAATLDAANERVQQMSERLNTAQSETGHTRETEDILHRTLLLAQRAADEAVNEAAAKARQMVDDAEIQSRRLIADAEADARRRGESERRRLEEEILDLATRRDTLLADVEALTRFEADYRDRSVRALEADLAALRSRPPASQPSFSSPAYAEPSAPEETESRRGPDESTQAIDVQALFDRAGESTPVQHSFEQPVAKTATAAQPDPSEGDSEVLDDDAFFATLREAVHDDSPLGPRDEGASEDDFYGDEGERASFRDVFRRRR